MARVNFAHTAGRVFEACQLPEPVSWRTSYQMLSCADAIRSPAFVSLKRNMTVVLHHSPAGVWSECKCLGRPDMNNVELNALKIDLVLQWSGEHRASEPQHYAT